MCKNFIIFLVLIPFVCLAKPSQQVEEISNTAKEFFEIYAPVSFVYQQTHYQIFIAKSKHKTKNVKVLYTLDGNAFFPRFLNIFKESPKESLLVVGIGYEGDLAFYTRERRRDYTPKVLGDEFSGGGGDGEFLSFLKTQVFPYIEERYNVQDKAIFGHSFGGLFALSVLLQDHTLFTHYFIASPSLWWGDSSFLPKDLNLSACPKIYVTLGSLEVGKRKSTINAEELSAKISLSCPVSFKLFENQTHGSVIPKAMQFALENF